LSTIDPEALLAKAAGRATERRFFLASALAAYQELHGMDDNALAAYLGCPPDRLSRLALCRRPDPGSTGFRNDTQRVAAYAGANPLRLGTLLRAVESAEALRGDGDASGALLAARDAEPEDGDEPSCR
jgi:hypothetical protein